MHPAFARLRAPQAALVVGALVVGSLALRTGAMGSGYWTDEGIAVGIASHPLHAIPGTLRQDGSPPFYYLLLHVWMACFGRSEEATRSLSLAAALLTIPVSLWAGTRLFDRRAGYVAAAGAAALPFLTRYGQETRMYALVVLLSVVASAAFVLGLVRDEPRQRRVLVGALVLLLYTHNWGVFLTAALGLVWLVLWRAGRTRGRDGATVGAAVALLYAPWVSALLFQAAHTAAPWAEPPSLLRLLHAPQALMGAAAVPLLLVAVVAAVRRNGITLEAALLAAVAVLTLGTAWLASQLEPAWAVRYLAVVAGPLLLALAGTVSRGGRVPMAAAAAVGVLWCTYAPARVRSNVRTVAQAIAPELRRDDVVMASAPEDVPVLEHYLPGGLRYLTPTGAVPDSRVTDWRDIVTRLRHAPTRRILDRSIAAISVGGHLTVVTPAFRRPDTSAPLQRAVLARSTQIRAAVALDPRLALVRTVPTSLSPDIRSQVRADVYVRLAQRLDR